MHHYRPQLAVRPPSHTGGVWRTMPPGRRRQMSPKCAQAHSPCMLGAQSGHLWTLPGTLRALGSKRCGAEIWFARRPGWRAPVKRQPTRQSNSQGRPSLLLPGRRRGANQRANQAPTKLSLDTRHVGDTATPPTLIGVTLPRNLPK